MFLPRRAVGFALLILSILLLATFASAQDAGPIGLQRRRNHRHTSSTTAKQSTTSTGGLLIGPLLGTSTTSSTHTSTSSTKSSTSSTKTSSTSSTKTSTSSTKTSSTSSTKTSTTSTKTSSTSSTKTSTSSTKTSSTSSTKTSSTSSTKTSSTSSTKTSSTSSTKTSSSSSSTKTSSSSSSSKSSSTTSSTKSSTSSSSSSSSSSSDPPTTTTSSSSDPPTTTTSSSSDPPTTTTSSSSDPPTTTTSSSSDPPTTTTSSSSDPPTSTTTTMLNTTTTWTTSTSSTSISYNTTTTTSTMPTASIGLDQPCLVIATSASAADEASAVLQSYNQTWDLLVVPQNGTVLPALETFDSFGDSTGNYGLIVIIGLVSYEYGGTIGYASALTADQFTTLYNYQTKYSVRMIHLDGSPYSFPGVTIAPGPGGCCALPETQTVYLANSSFIPTQTFQFGDLSTDGLYHYPATITDSTSTTAFLLFGTNPDYNTTTVAGVVQNFSGRQQMVFFLLGASWSQTTLDLGQVWFDWGY